MDTHISFLNVVFTKSQHHVRLLYCFVLFFSRQIYDDGPNGTPYKLKSFTVVLAMQM